MFNTMMYAKKLEAVGLPREQAEAHVEMIAEIVEETLFTKQDAKELEFRLITKLTVIMGAMFTLWTGVIAVVFNLMQR